ncbi:MAG: hypothetical protein MZV63_66645 [Marinilabiliales bacterium]|nr:hypothetical protein [Marinilabiliales bacterium]
MGTKLGHPRFILKARGHRRVRKASRRRTRIHSACPFAVANARLAVFRRPPRIRNTTGREEQYELFIDTKAPITALVATMPVEREDGFHVPAPLSRCIARAERPSAITPPQISTIACRSVSSRSTPMRPPARLFWGPAW